MKKFFTLIAGLLICAATAVHAANGGAELTVGGADTGIIKWGMEKENPVYAIKGETRGLYLSGADSLANALYFNIEDSVAFGQTDAATVTVQYYDEGTSDFYLSYTKFDASDYSNKIEKNSVTCTDTKTWKTTTFIIDNVVFENRIDKIGGADFYLGVDSGANITIKSVKLAVSGTPTFLKVSASTDKYGNIFASDSQEVKLGIKKVNGGTASAVLTYKVLYDGETVASGTKNVEVSEIIATENLEFEFSKYGLYEFRGEITADGVTQKVKLPFSVINKCTMQNNKMFVCSHYAHNQYAEPEKTTEAIKQAGFGGVRDGLYWFVVEKTKGEYTIPTYTKYFTTDMKENGMDTLMCLTHGNNLYCGINNVPTKEEDVEAFAAYCAAVAKECKGVVKYYEIWNEFCDRYEDRTEAGKAYAPILIAASKAIKAVDPDAKIVAMAMCGNWENFVTACMDELKARGEEDCFDIVSLHPYQLYETNWYKDFIKTVSDKIGGKEIWYSEHGYHTGTSDSYGVSKTEQAVLGIQDYVTSIANNYCTRYYWYDFMCDGANANDREQNFGLLESEDAEFPATARPAYVAMTAFNKLLGQSEFSSYSKSLLGVQIYKFVDAEGRNSYVFWGDKGRTVTINAGTKNMDYRDMYSNIVKTMHSESGIYTLTVGEGINYLTDCDIEKRGVLNMGLSENNISISGKSESPNQNVTLLISSETQPVVYLKQVISGDNCGFAFDANIGGNDELSVKVYYGDLYKGNIAADISIKLTSGGKTISSPDEIVDNAFSVVVKLNKAIDKKLNVFAAKYNGNELSMVNKVEIPAGKTDEIEFPMEYAGENEISCFVWDTGMNSVKNKVFEKQGEEK